MAIGTEIYALRDVENLSLVSSVRNGSKCDVALFLGYLCFIPENRQRVYEYTL